MKQLKYFRYKIHVNHCSALETFQRGTRSGAVDVSEVATAGSERSRCWDNITGMKSISWSWIYQNTAGSRHGASRACHTFINFPPILCSANYHQAGNCSSSPVTRENWSDVEVDFLPSVCWCFDEFFWSSSFLSTINWWKAHVLTFEFSLQNYSR